MALAIHVIAHKLTDTVLAACTRGDTDEPTDLVAELVGDKLTLTQATDPTLVATDADDVCSFDASELVVEKVPSTNLEPTTASVLQSPIGYVITRDNQGAVQSIAVQSPPTNSTVTSGSITFTFPNALTATGIDGFIRLVSTTTAAVVDQQVVFKPETFNSPDAKVQLTAGPGSYTMIALATGFGPLIGALTIT